MSNFFFSLCDIDFTGQNRCLLLEIYKIMIAEQKIRVFRGILTWCKNDRGFVAFLDLHKIQKQFIWCLLSNPLMCSKFPDDK